MVCKTHKQVDWAENIRQSCVYFAHQLSIIFMITCAVEVQIDYLTLALRNNVIDKFKFQFNHFILTPYAQSQRMRFSFKFK
jgi:hypothetical protein